MTTTNPYQSPEEQGSQKSERKNSTSSKRTRRWWIIPAIIASPSVLLAVSLFWTAYSYVGTAAAADHPIVPAYLQAGVFFLGLGMAAFTIGVIVNRPNWWKVLFLFGIAGTMLAPVDLLYTELDVICYLLVQSAMPALVIGGIGWMLTSRRRAVRE
jgi:hypothetical protein